MLQGLSDGLIAIVGFSDDFEAVTVGEHVAHANADYGMVVGEYDADGLLFHVNPIPPKAGTKRKPRKARFTNILSVPGAPKATGRPRCRRKFLFKHTLQPFRGRIQVPYGKGTVIQLVTAGLEEGSQPGGLHGASHAASAFDRMTDAADFVLVAVSDGFLECGQSFMQVGDNGSCRSREPSTRS